MPIQLASEIETFVTTAFDKKEYRCLPEPRSLLRVEVDIFTGSELGADINVFEGNDNTLDLLVLGGTRSLARFGH